jgi:hypothetical protein
MTDETKPTIRNLESEEQELTPEQAEEAQGGFLATPEYAKPTIEIGVVSTSDSFVGENYRR